jgi:hypothetical protein
MEKWISLNEWHVKNGAYINGIEIKPKPKCNHVQKQYIGFTDKYDYCEICNDKIWDLNKIGG